MPIPLAGDETLVFDFDRVYQHTFYSRRYANLLELDYTQPPVRFDTYRQDDRERIWRHMAEIAGLV